jgi:hypothetical protein
MKKETKYKLKMFGPNMKTWPAGIIGVIGCLYVEDND